MHTAAPERGTARKLIPLGLIFLASGLSTAVVMPFLALFLSDEVEAGPLRVTIFLVVAPLSGVVVSWLIGRASDRGPVRRKLIITASLAGLAGCALIAVTRDYWVLLVLYVTAIALAGALFPQSFAYARQVLQRDDPSRAAMGISSLRTVFSLAWVGGPPLAALLLDKGGFTAVYAMAAAMYAVAALVAVFRLIEIGQPEVPEVTGDEPPPAHPWRMWLAAAGFTLLQTPLVLAVQALPLFISRDLGGRVSDAGLILGLCAALEIPLMLGFGWLSTRMPLHRLIVAGGVCGVAYYGLATVATSVWMLVAGQILNAVFIAAVSGLGISYMQDMMPSQPGRATTLFTNSFPIGAMLAGPLLGVAQGSGFRLAYAMSTSLCLLGLVILVVNRQRRRIG